MWSCEHEVSINRRWIFIFWRHMLEENFFWMEKKFISISFQFVSGIQQRFFALFSEEKVTFNPCCQIFQCCGCCRHSSVPTSHFWWQFSRPKWFQNSLSYSYNSWIFYCYAFVDKKMRHIVFVLNFVTLRFALLQIKIIQLFKLFTLSSPHAKDNQIPNFAGHQSLWRALVRMSISRIHALVNPWATTTKDTLSAVTDKHCCHEEHEEEWKVNGQTM